METDRNNPIYTQKHYIDIAECLAKFQNEYPHDIKTIETFTNVLIDRFTEDNDKFDPDKFISYISKLINAL